MRRALLSVGQLCCIFGLQVLLVDKIVPHRFVPVPAQLLDRSSGASDAGPRVIDLPDSGGYVLMALGIVCLMYVVALGGKKADG